MNIRTSLLVSATLLSAAGCFTVKTESEIKPIHITMDVNLKVDKELDKAFADENMAKPKGDFKEIKDLLDKNKVPTMSTSTGGGKLQNGTSVTEQAEYMTRYLIIEHTGDTKENYRKAGIFYIDGCTNIIMRNLQFVGPGSIDVGGYDLVSCINKTTHLWVDHCDFTDGIDGNFDITNESDFVTVSWCTFSYTDRSYMHQNTNLVGSSDSKTADEDKLNITYAYNIWGAKCRARMPMARFGTIHMLNNYFNCAGNASACINPRKNSEFLIEGNYFEKGVKNIESYKFREALKEAMNLARIGNKYISFKKVEITNTLGEYLAAKGLKQLRLAETEKYAHVTFFFNGGIEDPNKGEDRTLVNSPKVATYDLQPEMSAPEVSEKLDAAITSGAYDVIIINFANPDMVGHTGVQDAAIKAVEAVFDWKKWQEDVLSPSEEPAASCREWARSSTAA